MNVRTTFHGNPPSSFSYISLTTLNMNWWSHCQEITVLHGTLIYEQNLYLTVVQTFTSNIKGIYTFQFTWPAYHWSERGSMFGPPNPQSWHLTPQSLVRTRQFIVYYKLSLYILLYFLTDQPRANSQCVITVQQIYWTQAESEWAGLYVSSHTWFTTSVICRAGSPLFKAGIHPSETNSWCMSW